MSRPQMADCNLKKINVSSSDNICGSTHRFKRISTLLNTFETNTVYERYIAGYTRDTGGFLAECTLHLTFSSPYIQ
jgi:hypothetical protein